MKAHVARFNRRLGMWTCTCGRRWSAIESGLVEAHAFVTHGRIELGNAP